MSIVPENFTSLEELTHLAAFHDAIQKTPFKKLVSLVCESAYAETDEILSSIIHPKPKIFFYEIFFELLAWKQFYFLSIYYSNYGFNQEFISTLGCYFNEICVKLTENKRLKKLLSRALSENNFHSLVSKYLACDKTTVINIDEAHFKQLVKFISFNKHSDDYIVFSSAISFSRILKVFELSFNDQSWEGISLMWLSYIDRSIKFKGYLRNIVALAPCDGRQVMKSINVDDNAATKTPVVTNDNAKKTIVIFGVIIFLLLFVVLISEYVGLKF